MGSPVGARIICNVAQTLIAVIDWGLDAHAVVDLPRRCNRDGATELGRDADLASVEPAWATQGHAGKMLDMDRGLHIIDQDHVGDGHSLSGAADPRRKGVVAGR